MSSSIVFVIPVLVASDRAEALSEKQTKHTEIIGNPVPQIEYWTKTKDGWGGGLVSAARIYARNP